MKTDTPFYFIFLLIVTFTRDINAKKIQKLEYFTGSSCLRNDEKIGQISYVLDEDSRCATESCTLVSSNYPFSMFSESSYVKFSCENSFDITGFTSSFAVQVSYEDNQCGEIEKIIAVLPGTCMKHGSQSIQYTCDKNSTFLLKAFSDSTCKDLHETEIPNHCMQTSSDLIQYHSYYCTNINPPSFVSTVSPTVTPNHEYGSERHTSPIGTVLGCISFVILLMFIIQRNGRNLFHRFVRPQNAQYMNIY